MAKNSQLYLSTVKEDGVWFFDGYAGYDPATQTVTLNFSAYKTVEDFENGQAPLNTRSTVMTGEDYTKVLDKVNGALLGTNSESPEAIIRSILDGTL